MIVRTSTITRKTKETEVTLTLNLDGTGKADVQSGCGFLDHMLTLLASHAHYDLTLRCVGDTRVDDHHTVEDVGICLGRALREALGDMRGILRYGSRVIPMDETLILSAVDISGRDYLGYEVEIPTWKVGSFDTELCEEFFSAFVREARLTLHIRRLAGSNSHHIIEGVFKSVAHSLSDATAIDSRFANEVPSTKGVLA